MTTDELKSKLLTLADTYYVNINLHLEDGPNTWYASAQSNQPHGHMLVTKSYSNLEDVIDVLELRLKEQTCVISWKK